MAELLETYLFVTGFIAVVGLSVFIVIGAIIGPDADENEKHVLRALLIMVAVSWTWPVAIPVVTLYSLYRAIKSVI